jgi:predicted ABC-type transport system involved in lysophospholipase L1 biosynthesis ATPase subunit
MALLIQAEGIHKTYHIGAKAVPVLRGASLAVREGETVAIVGMSGAGKSTLLYIMGALHRPDQGRVLIGEEDLYGIAERRRAAIRAGRLGFVFQSYHLLPEMDVLENVMLPMMTKGGLFASRACLRERAMALLTAVGLAERAAHTPMELSGGEQQRVAVARALVNDPQIVLADEPTGNLDEATGRQVLDGLFALTRARGHALLLVTHNERIASTCDRTLRLSEGVLVEGR